MHVLEIDINFFDIGDFKKKITAGNIEVSNVMLY